MLDDAARRQPSDDSHLINLNASSSRLLWLATCIAYLLFLRFVGALISNLTDTPLRLKTHIARIESCIVNLTASIFRVVPGDRHASSAQRRGRPGRDESFSGRSTNSPSRNIIAPRRSSLEFDGMSDASYRQLDPAWLTHRPQAPRPPYRRGSENLRLPTTLAPPQPAIVSRGVARTFGYDGSISSTIISPVPGLPAPSIPTFMTRMPYLSVSDSIYSSSSAGLLGRRRCISTSSSLGGKTPVKPEIYTDLLPARPSLDCDDSSKAQEEKVVQNAPFKSGLSFSGKFPTSEELDYSSLPTAAQQIIPGSERIRK